MSEQDLTVEKLVSAPIAVVGGCGALGGRVVQKLQSFGAAQLRVIDRHVPERGVPGVDYVEGELLDTAAMSRALDGTEVVFHLAGLKVAGDSAAQAAAYFEINAAGTALLMDACRNAGVSLVSYASTSHVYGVPNRLPVTEDHPCRPLSIYAASKLGGEAAVQGFAAAFGIRVSIARLCNVYGGTLGPETVAGRILALAADQQPVELRNLAAVRDFLYIDDAVEGLIRLSAAQTEPGCDIANVSPGAGTEVRELASAAVDAAAELGLGELEVHQSGDSADEGVPSLFIDNQHLRRKTGWHPSTALRDGLKAALQDMLSRRQS